MAYLVPDDSMHQFLQLKIELVNQNKTYNIRRQYLTMSQRIFFLLGKVQQAKTETSPVNLIEPHSGPRNDPSSRYDPN